MSGCPRGFLQRDASLPLNFKNCRAGAMNQGVYDGLVGLTTASWWGDVIVIIVLAIVSTIAQTRASGFSSNSDRVQVVQDLGYWNSSISQTPGQIQNVDPP